MVEWKRLGDIGEVCMCKRIMKDQTSDSGEIPFFKIGTFGSTADSYISRELFDDYKKKYSYPKKGEILISASGTIGRSVIFDGKDAYFQDSNIVWISNDESAVLNKYLYYCYQIIDWKVDGGTIKRLYNYNLKNATIPVPSLPEQNRIVGILDTFTSSIENLKEQIAQRRKQYEYYRDQLLDLEGKPGVEMIKLGIVCKIGDGIHGTPLYDENGDYYFVNGNNLSNGKIVIKPDTKRVNEEMFAKYGVELDKSTILMSINGTIGNIAYYNNERLVLGKSAAYFKVTNKNLLDNRYLYYLLQATKSIDYYDGMLTGSTIKNLGIKALRNYAVPVPSLQEQQRIVSILDTFEASIQNLEDQLSLREKQYEYYRNKLLTFE